MIVADLTAALPEVFLACAGMALLMLGVFRGEGSLRLVMSLSVVAIVIAAALLIVPARPATIAFGGLFVTDTFGDFMKLLVLIGAAVTMIMSLRFVEREQMARFEIPILMLFATLGMLMMVSANDLISLYIGLELQSLSLYVIAAIRRDNLCVDVARRTVNAQAIHREHLDSRARFAGTAQSVLLFVEFHIRLVR